MPTASSFLDWCEKVKLPPTSYNHSVYLSELTEAGWLPGRHRYLYLLADEPFLAGGKSSVKIGPPKTGNFWQRIQLVRRYLERFVGR